ncbi:MAG: hypothetical protein RL217_1302, partial [Pseudomonadota bacterium]
LLVYPLAHVGLALATSLSAFFNAFMLYWMLRKQGVYQHQGGWPAFLSKALLANIALAAVILLLSASAQEWMTWATSVRIYWLTGIVSAGIAVYFAVLFALGFRLKHLKGEMF